MGRRYKKSKKLDIVDDRLLYLYKHIYVFNDTLLQICNKPNSYDYLDNDDIYEYFAEFVYLKIKNSYRNY